MIGKSYLDLDSREILAVLSSKAGDRNSHHGHGIDLDFQEGCPIERAKYTRASILDCKTVRP